MGSQSNCSVVFTLLKVIFLGKWDECGERPFPWPLTSFPDRHTHSVHSVQCCLSSCFEQFCWDIIRPLYFCPVVYFFFFFFLLSFFPRLISGVGDWMSTILLHMVWP